MSAQPLSTAIRRAELAVTQPTGHRERTLPLIICNNKPCLLCASHCAKFWQALFHEDPARWAFYLHFTGERPQLGEVKHLPTARNWRGGGAGPGSRPVLALKCMQYGHSCISQPPDIVLHLTVSFHDL